MAQQQPWQTQDFLQKYKDPKVRATRTTNISKVRRAMTGDLAFDEDTIYSDKEIWEWDNRTHLEIDCKVVDKAGANTLPWSGIDEMPLTTLVLVQLWPSWQEFPPFCLFGRQPNLVNVTITYASGLTNLPDTFNRLKNLETLVLDHCTALTALPFTSPMVRLKVISLRACKSITAMPNAMKDMPSLTKLDVFGCNLKLTSELSATNGFKLPPLKDFSDVQKKRVADAAQLGVTTTRGGTKQ